MQLIIQREAFLKPLRAVAGVVERRHAQTLPILSNVLIEIDKDTFSLTTTDQEVELIAYGRLSEPLDEPHSFTVPLRKLMDICKALPEQSEIKMIHEEDRVILRGGRSRFTLSTLPPQEFPKLENYQGDLELTIMSSALRFLLNGTCFAMGEQDVRSYLNGMLFEVKEGILYAVAADGHRMAINSHMIGASMGEEQSGDQFSKPMRVIIPRKGVLELLRILEDEEEEITLRISPNHIQAKTSLVTLTSKLLDSRFPEYERIIPKEGNKIMIAPRSDLKEAFQRAATLLSDKQCGIRLELSPGNLKILATNTEQDEVEEDVEVDYQGDELEIGFNVKYLIEFLNVIKADDIKFIFTESNASARVEGKSMQSGVYVIMPMRI